MRIEINIPSTLSEITLQQYKRYLKIIENNAEGENAERFIQLKMLEIFCNIPYSTGMQLRIKDINKATDHIASLLNAKQDLVQEFVIGDTTFGFIPKLDDMTFGEYIDLDNSLSDWNNMHKAMAVLYRPITKRIGKFYNVEAYRGDNYHEAMELTPLNAVFSSIVFFYRLGNDLSQLMTNYLQEDQQMSQELQQGLQKSGVGINQFMHSLKEILEDLKISQV